MICWTQQTDWQRAASSWLAAVNSLEAEGFPPEGQLSFKYYGKIALIW